jgi:DHA1 family tetracycline resistance protein-like MFS transporter
MHHPRVASPSRLRLDPGAWLIFAILVLDVAGIGLIIPVLPYYATAYGAGGLAVGLLFSSYSIAQFLSTPFLGALSDRHGRRPVLLLSQFGAACAYLLLGLAGSLGMLFLARIIGGITAGNASTAQAYLADRTPEEERTKSYALLGAAFGIGFLIGPAAGGVLSQVHPRLPAFAAAAVALTSLLTAWRFLPESLPRERRGRAQRSLNPLAVLARYAWRPGLRNLLWANFLLNVAFSGLQTNFAVWASRRFGFGPRETATAFVDLALTALVVQGLVIRRVAGRVPDRILAIAGFGLTALGFAAVVLAPVVPALYTGLAVLAAGAALGQAPLTSLQTSQVDAIEQGALSGAGQALASLARIFGPLWAGALYSWLTPDLPYWSGALLLALGALALWPAGRVPSLVPVRDRAYDEALSSSVLRERGRG